MTGEITYTAYAFGFILIYDLNYRSRCQFLYFALKCDLLLHSFIHSFILYNCLKIINLQLSDERRVNCKCEAKCHVFVRTLS